MMVLRRSTPLASMKARIAGFSIDLRTATVSSLSPRSSIIGATWATPSRVSTPRMVRTGANSPGISRAMETASSARTTRRCWKVPWAIRDSGIRDSGLVIRDSLYSSLIRMLRNSTWAPWPRKPMWPLVLAMPRDPSGLLRSRCLLRSSASFTSSRLPSVIVDPVELHRNLPPLHGDLLRVPFPHRFLVAALRRKHVVDRPVVLRGLELRVLRAAVVEHLDLHPDVRGVAHERRADPDAVVRVLGQLDVEAQNEVRVFLLGVQVSAVFLRGEEDAVRDLVALARLFSAPLARRPYTQPVRSLPLNSCVNPASCASDTDGIIASPRHATTSWYLVSSFQSPFHGSRGARGLVEPSRFR